MKKILLKIGLFFAATAALIAVLSPILIKKFLPPEKLRALVVEGAQKGLHRQVKLGDVSLGLVTGLTLKDLSISELPDFNAGTFASVKAFTVKVRLMPLLHKEVVLNSITADGLTLRVAKGEDGRFNFSDLTDAPPAAAGSTPGAPSAATPVKVEIRSLRLTGASVSYGEGAQRTISLKDLDAKIGGFSLSGPFTADLKAAASGRWDGRDVDGRASFTGRLDLGGSDPRKFWVDARSVEIFRRGWTAKISGTVMNLSRPDVDVKVSVAGAPGPVADAGFKGSIAYSSGPLAVDGALTFSTPGLKASDAVGFGFPPGMPLPPLKASGKLSYGGDAARFQDLSIAASFGKVEGAATIAALSSAKPEPDVDVALALDLPMIRAQDAPWAKLPAGLVVPPLKIEGRAKVKGDFLTTPGLTVKGLFGSVKFSGAARKTAAGKPDLDMAWETSLNIPALKAADLPWAVALAGFSLPAAKIASNGRIKGDDLTLSSFHLAVTQGTLDASGSVRGVTSGAPQPNLDVAAKLALPSFISSDVPLPVLPPGLIVPASQWDGTLSVSRDEASAKALHIVIGKNDFVFENAKVTGMRGATPAVTGLLKCKQFQLDEVTGISPTTRDWGLKGSGFFALAFSGRLPKPIIQGKLQFKDIGAKVEGMDVSAFTGTVKFDERRIDVPNLRGNLGDGELALDLTIKNYATAPDIDLQGSLTKLDLGKYLAAKTALAAKKQAAKNPTAAAEEAKAAAPINARGKFSIAEIIHPNAALKDIRFDWDLTGYTPTFKTLNGTAKASSAGGRLTSLNTAGNSKALNVVISLMYLLEQATRSSKGEVGITEMVGEYTLRDGVATFGENRIEADIASISAKGEVSLVGQRLNVTATAGTPLGTYRVPISGPLENPVLPSAGKIIADAAVRAAGDGLKKAASQGVNGLLDLLQKK